MHILIKGDLEEKAEDIEEIYVPHDKIYMRKVIDKNNVPEQIGQQRATNPPEYKIQVHGLHSGDSWHLMVTRKEYNRVKKILDKLNRSEIKRMIEEEPELKYEWPAKEVNALSGVEL